MEDMKLNFLDDGENLQLTMVDEEGNEVLYDVILTFDSDEFEQSYLLMVPVEAPEGDDDDEETVEVLAYAYTKTADGGIENLIPVESDDEWDMIEEVFNTNFEEVEDDE